jgi:hypothetical protein
VVFVRSLQGTMARKHKIYPHTPAEPPDNHPKGVYALTCMRIFNMVSLKDFFPSNSAFSKDQQLIRGVLNDLHKRGIIALDGLPQTKRARGCPACQRRRQRNGIIQIAKCFQSRLLKASEDEGKWSELTAQLHSYMAEKGIKQFSRPARLYAVLKDKSIREIDV